MEKHGTITNVKFVNGWKGNEETLYFHEITFDNGDQGKLSDNTLSNPKWLFENNKICYNIKESNRGRLISFIRENNNTDINIQNKENTIYNLPNEYDKLTQQKCISMNCCIERSNSLVLANKLDINMQYEYAFNQFKLIMKIANIEIPEMEINFPSINVKDIKQKANEKNKK